MIADDRSPGSDTAGRIVPFGDAAVLLTFGGRVEPELAWRAQAIAAAIEDARLGEPALGRAVPAHASVLVPFDPLAIELDAVVAIVRRAATEHRHASVALDGPAAVETAVAIRAALAAAGIDVRPWS